MVVLFDLDFTLIDSFLIAHLRQTRQPQAVYQMIPQILVYERIHELLQALKARNIPIARRKPFCDQLIAHLITCQNVRNPTSPEFTCPAKT
jgi:hypothetical protein